VIRNADPAGGVALHSLHTGSVVDLETKNHRYRIEYLGGDKARISGHPRLCPDPITVVVQGSIGQSVEPGFIAPGMHLVFRRLDDSRSVTTSEIKEVRVADAA